jgi:peptide/nickel transport system substrate-binding protein
VGFGRLHREEELRSHGPASVGRCPLYKRRTATRLSCGVSFVLFGLAACTSPPPKSFTPDQLKIGVPEGIVEGTDLGMQQVAARLSVESLSQLSDNGRPLPKLAESWWWENNGLRLNVHLRPGVKFHDGTPLTAGLATSLLEEAISKPSNRGLFTSFADVRSVHAEGDRRLVFDLARPSAFLPEDLEVPLQRGNPPNGTGPFQVTKREPNEIVLERFPQYYLGTPKINRISIRPFDTMRTAWTSLLRGNVDMVTDVPPDAVEFIRNQDVRVVSFGRRYQYLVALNSRKPPLNSPLVRRALNMAINRDELIQSALRGHGVPSTGPLWPKYWAYNTSIASYRFDPGLANSLLNSAGLRTDKQPGGRQTRFRFTCLIPENFNVIERVALEVQKQLYDVGVDMQFEVVPIKDFDTRVRAGKFDAMLIATISGPTVGRSYMLWRSARRFPGGLNFFGYENPEADRLFEVMRTSTNDVATQSAFSRLQETLLENPPALFLAWDEHSRAVRRDFQIVQDERRDIVDPIDTMWRWATIPEPQFALAK